MCFARQNLNREEVMATASERWIRSSFCLLPCFVVVTTATWNPGANPELVKELGFEVLEERFINEYKSTATLYRHKKTGAEIMSVTNDDENKVFGIVFRTPP